MTTGEPRIRLGIIGAGIMGERMLRAALDHAQDVADVCAIWDAAPAALDRIAAFAPDVVRADSADAAMRMADCVYIATPPATHLSYAAQAIGQGRAVFLEKPLATDVSAASAFVRDHAEARAAVHFPCASSFAVELLRRWITEDAIGPAPSRLDIEVAFAAWPRGWQQAAASWLDAPAEGGFTREVVSHFLFLARRVLGPLHLLSAHVDRAPGRAEHKVTATLDAGGVPVRLRGAVGETTADDHNTWTLHGVGAVRLRDWSWAERQQPGGGWTTDPEAAPNERMRLLVLRRQLEGVARMTRGQPHHLATLQDALEVQAIVESILAAPPHG
jgi:predicted dehydrogenase